jgi:hypothetical protein
MYMRPQEPYREDVTQEILDRNPPRFARLMGEHLDFGWREEGPDFTRVAKYPLHSQFD